MSKIDVTNFLPKKGAYIPDSSQWVKTTHIPLYKIETDDPVYIPHLWERMYAEVMQAISNKLIGSTEKHVFKLTPTVKLCTLSRDVIPAGHPHEHEVEFKLIVDYFIFTEADQDTPS